jgi:hypothetical protein
MINELKSYYKKNGILATSFTCSCKSECQGDGKGFTGPKSAFVSTGYEARELPRLLFLSLDSGKGSGIDSDRLPRSVRKRMEAVDVSSIPKGRHWYRTHELAWYILKHYDPDLKIEETKRYLAHANSAKCCMNKEGSKKADRVLFKNCQRYLKGELSILCPEIIVTQGNEARNAIHSLCEKVVKRFDEFASIIRFNGEDVFWLHTYHPSCYGKFYEQRDFDKSKNIAKGWVKYSKKMHRFITNYY